MTANTTAVDVSHYRNYIPADTLSEVTGAHVYLIENVTVFFSEDHVVDPLADWTDTLWSPEHITAVLQDYRTTGDNQHYPEIFIGAPQICLMDILSPGFVGAWAEWAQNRRNGGELVNYIVEALGENDFEHYVLCDLIPDAPVKKITFLTQEYYLAYGDEPDNSHGTEEPDVSAYDIWKEVFADRLPFALDLSDWGSTVYKPLAERVDDGDVHIPTGPDYDGSDSLYVVTVVSGTSDKLQVAPLWVTRRYSWASRMP